MLLQNEHLENNVPTTNAILVKGYETGDLNQSSIENIQLQIMEVLQDLIKRYTQGDSSSVRVEVAERILISIHYIMDLYISAIPTYEEQLLYLQTKGAKVVYNQGLQVIQDLLVDTSALYEMLDKNMLDVPNEVYTDTFKIAIPTFLKHYDFHYNAYDIKCSIDYPLIFDDTSLEGATFINHYLKILKMETEFCQLFPTEDIIELLLDYGRKHRIDVVNAPINLFELTFNNALFSLLSEEIHIQLTLSQNQFDGVNGLMSNLPQTEMPDFIMRAIHKLMTDLSITQAPLVAYIKQYSELLIPRIINALVNGTLYNIPVIKESVHEKIYFEKATMMDDEAFRAIVDELLECDESQEKLHILANNVHSIEDFIDILNADCLFGTEIRDAYKILDEIELAVLALIIFNDDYIGTAFHLEPALIQKKMAECDVEWQQEFLKFMQGLDNELLIAMENIMKQMV